VPCLAARALACVLPEFSLLFFFRGQAPGFIEALHLQLPRDVHLIYTYPNVSTCANVSMAHTKEKPRYPLCLLVHLQLLQRLIFFVVVFFKN
jgi:hypothetical protein